MNTFFDSVTLSSKSSLMAGENTAAFRREGHFQARFISRGTHVRNVFAKSQGRLPTIVLVQPSSW